MDYNFNVKTNKSDSLTLDDFKGKLLVLYFYPKDNTPGCSIQAADFSDMYDEFKSLGAEILGVSKDSKSSHDKFTEKFNIPYELVVDDEKKLLEQYGVLEDGTMFGKPVKKTIRSTFLFDEEGNLIKEWRKVQAKGHAEEVLEFIKEYKNNK